MMRVTEDSNQAKLRNALNQELKLRYREFFESSLAVDLLSHPEYFSSVMKVSAAIVKFIAANQGAVIDLITNNSIIKKELSTPYFGSCYDDASEVKPDQIVEKISSILEDKKSDLAQVMQIHGMFIYRIYDKIERNSNKTKLDDQFHHHSFFNKQECSRIENKNDEVKLSLELGISKNPVFAKMVGQSNTLHARGMDKYNPNYQASFFKSLPENHTPVICGPSGDTASLMKGALLYGDLKSDELKEYALASFVFLAAGGNHSFHEVMTVSNIVGVDFKENNYLVSLPQSVKNTPVYKALICRFPEFLDQDEEDKTSTKMSVLGKK